MKKVYYIVFVFFIFLVLVVYLSVFHYSLLFSWYVTLCSKDSLEPFLDLSHRPSIKDLKKNFHVIREEMLASRHLFSSIRNDLFFEEKIIKDDKWKKIYLKWYAESPAYAYTLFPRTTALLDKHKDIHLAMFSLLEAGAEILPHRGPMAGCHRTHLCLTAPNDDNCYIEVDGQRYSWREGEIVSFSDVYRHSVKNNTDKERIVLFLDLEREMYMPWLNRWVIKNIASKTTRMNDEIEKKHSRKIEQH